MHVILYTRLSAILSRRRPTGAATFWWPRGGSGSRTGRITPTRGVCRPKTTTCRLGVGEPEVGGRR